MTSKRSHLVISRARQLRHDETAAERFLWSRLRRRQLEGVSFRGQHPLGGLVVDFCAPQEKLVIELDGGQHNEAENRRVDEQRTGLLARRGYRVIRFWNHDVLQNPEGVLLVIRGALSRPPSP